MFRKKTSKEPTNIFKISVFLNPFHDFSEIHNTAILILGKNHKELNIYQSLILHMSMCKYILIHPTLNKTYTHRGKKGS